MVIMDHLTMVSDTTPPIVQKYMDKFSLTREEAEYYRDMILAEKMAKLAELIIASKSLESGHC